jgi:hypothetical protein
MGFFSKLADAVTGGWVKVRLQHPEPALGKPLEVRIQADEVKSDHDIDGVYIQVTAEERVKVPEVHVAETVNGAVKETVKDVEGSVITFDRKFPVAGPQSLKIGQTYEWTGTITLPADAKPSYVGVQASHTWRIMAGLEVKGNDPDSGRTVIVVGR